MSHFNFDLEAEALSVDLRSVSDASGIGLNGVRPSVEQELEHGGVRQGADALLAATDTQSDVEQRPHKKRKVDGSDFSDSQVAYLPDDRSVVLLRIRLNLVMHTCVAL